MLTNDRSYSEPCQMSILKLVGALHAGEVSRVPGRVSFGVVGMVIRQEPLPSHFSEDTEVNSVLCSSSG